MDANGELIKSIFDNLDSFRSTSTNVSFYDYLKTIRPILGGTTVLLAGITDNVAQAKIDYKLIQTDLDIFVHTSEVVTILGILRSMIPKTDENTILLTRPSFMKDSAFQLYGINMRYSLDLQDIISSGQDDLPMAINVYSIDDRRSLVDALGVYGIDVLTSYIQLDTSPESLKISTYHSEEIKEGVANITPFAAQNYFNNRISSHPNKSNRGDDFIYSDSEPALLALEIKLKVGKHTIDMDPLDMSQMFTEEGNRRFILGDIADFTKYFMKVGFGKHSDDLILGTVINKPFQRTINSQMDPFFEKYNYYSNSIENLYKFYKQCIDHSLKTTAPWIFHDGVSYKITFQDPSTDPSVLQKQSFGEIGTERYVDLKYSFDVNVYKQLTENNEKEAYYRKCFYNHCMYWTSLYRGYYRKKWNWYFTNSDYQQQARDILSEIEEFCTKDYRESIEVDKEVDMGVAIDPSIEDLVDEDGYLDIKEALYTDNFSILYIRNSNGSLGDPIIIDKLKLVKESKTGLKSKLFYKCTDQFDGRGEPLDIGLYNVDFTNPYYNLTGGNQEILIRYSDLQSIMWINGRDSVSNAFILEREKEIHRVASLENINIQYGEDITGEMINIVSGYHCQSGVKKPVFGVKLAEITEFIDIEREKEEFRPVITLDDIFEKYPEAKELYESNIPKNTKIRNANRLDMEPDYKGKFMQSIMMQRQVVSPSPPSSPQRSPEYHVLDPDEPQREIGGNRYQSDSESDTEEPSNLQPMRLDFGEDQTQVLDPPITERRPVPDEEFKSAVKMYLDPSTRQQAVNLYGPISEWDVSSVTDMSEAFYSTDFNEDISKWDVSSVTNMDEIFRASKFNQPIGEWDVSNVTSMDYMFAWSNFNQDISEWDVSNLESTNNMFDSSDFNQPLNDWNVKSLRYAKKMFYHAKFKGPINKWRFRDIEDMTEFFSYSAYDNSDDNLEEWAENIEDLKPKMDNMFDASLMEVLYKIPSWYKEE